MRKQGKAVGVVPHQVALKQYLRHITGQISAHPRGQEERIGKAMQVLNTIALRTGLAHHCAP
jgi:hypothetical protein